MIDRKLLKKLSRIVWDVLSLYYKINTGLFSVISYLPFLFKNLHSEAGLLEIKIYIIFYSIDFSK